MKTLTSDGESISIPDDNYYTKNMSRGRRALKARGSHEATPRRGADRQRTPASHSARHNVGALKFTAWNSAWICRKKRPKCGMATRSSKIILKHHPKQTIARTREGTRISDHRHSHTMLRIWQQSAKFLIASQQLTLQYQQLLLFVPAKRLWAPADEATVCSSLIVLQPHSQQIKQSRIS